MVLVWIWPMLVDPLKREIQLLQSCYLFSILPIIASYILGCLVGSYRFIVVCLLARLDLLFLLRRSSFVPRGYLSQSVNGTTSAGNCIVMYKYIHTVQVHPRCSALRTCSVALWTNHLTAFCTQQQSELTPVSAYFQAEHLSAFSVFPWCLWQKTFLSTQARDLKLFQASVFIN